jgi:hypothetical protein
MLPLGGAGQPASVYGFGIAVGATWLVVPCVGVAVGVAVTTGVGVAVPFGVGVAVGTEVGVAVGAELGVGVEPTGVLVGALVGVFVGCAVLEPVGVAVAPDVEVGVAVAAPVGVGDELTLETGVGVAPFWVETGVGVGVTPGSPVPVPHAAKSTAAAKLPTSARLNDFI